MTYDEDSLQKVKTLILDYRFFDLPRNPPVDFVICTILCYIYIMYNGKESDSYHTYINKL